MRKLLPLLLALTLCTAACAAPFSADIQEALDCLSHCAFTAEFGSRESVLMRWEDPIVIHVSGKATKKDLAALDEFIRQVNERIPNMPDVRRTNSRAEANITMWFGPLDDMADHITDYTEGNWGYAYYWYNGRNAITRGEVAIASDVTNQRERNHLIQEELMCIFGLTNDHYCRKDSILYQPWTSTQQPNDADWLMLQMVYDPELAPGMQKSQAIRILDAKY